MLLESKSTPHEQYRRSLLRGAAAVGGVGLGGMLGLLPRTAFACHTYVSPVDGAKGCGPYTRDLANNTSDSDSSSSGSSTGSSSSGSGTSTGSGDTSSGSGTSTSSGDTSSGSGTSTSSGNSSSGGSTTSTPGAGPGTPSISSSGLNPTLSFGGQYLGCPLYSASKAPNGYWDKHAYRFVAEYTGTVKTVRWENRTGTGYSVGTGGTIQLSIQTDNGGYPSGVKLGTTAAYANAASIGHFPKLPFTTQPQLTYGTTYHIVFEQLTPNVGKVSVNDLHDWTPPPDGLVIFPLLKSKLASIRFENNAWRVMPGYIPIYELVYTDGIAKGQPWMDGGRGCFQNIGGGNVARQSFTMYDRAATVTGVYFAFFRTGTVGPVTISLTSSGGTALSTATIDGNQASISTEGDNSPVHWLYTPIGPTTFAKGGKYYVKFQAAAGSTLNAMPSTDGYFYGFANKAGVYVNRGAQYSTSGGASWGSWPMLGGRVSNWVSLPVFLKTFA